MGAAQPTYSLDWIVDAPQFRVLRHYGVEHDSAVKFICEVGDSFLDHAAPSQVLDLYLQRHCKQDGDTLELRGLCSFRAELFEAMLKSDYIVDLKDAMRCSANWWGQLPKNIINPQTCETLPLLEVGTRRLYHGTTIESAFGIVFGVGVCRTWNVPGRDFSSSCAFYMTPNRSWATEWARLKGAQASLVVIDVPDAVLENLNVLELSTEHRVIESIVRRCRDPRYSWKDPNSDEQDEEADRYLDGTDVVIGPILKAKSLLKPHLEWHPTATQWCFRTNEAVRVLRECKMYVVVC